MIIELLLIFYLKLKEELALEFERYASGHFYCYFDYYLFCTSQQQWPLYGDTLHNFWIIKKLIIWGTSIEDSVNILYFFSVLVSELGLKKVQTAYQSTYKFSLKTRGNIGTRVWVKKVPSETINV